jgi:hypothetical protein
LIQALNEGMWSVHAWQKALDSLPKENLSPGEIKQKEQYQAGLKAASEPRVINISGGAGSMPWDCAKAMKPDLILRGQEMATSSVSFGVFWSYNHYKNYFRLWHDRLGWFSVLMRYISFCFISFVVILTRDVQDFIGGVRSMNQLKKVQIAGGTAAMGMSDVIIPISSPFCLGANLAASGSGRPNQWHFTRQSSVPHKRSTMDLEVQPTRSGPIISRHLFGLYLFYAPLVIFEALKSKAWTEGGADFVIEEAQKRLRKQGWDAVRTALSTTIRLVFF